MNKGAQPLRLLNLASAYTYQNPQERLLHDVPGGRQRKSFTPKLDAHHRTEVVDKMVLSFRIARLEPFKVGRIKQLQGGGQGSHNMRRNRLAGGAMLVCSSLSKRTNFGTGLLILGRKVVPFVNSFCAHLRDAINKP